MDNFMDRLVDRMDGQGRGYDDDMPPMDDVRGGRFSSPRGRMDGRMDYGEPEDYGYRPSRQPAPAPSMPSIGRKDLEELGRAVVTEQKNLSDRQMGALDAIDRGIIDGFKEQGQKIDKIDEDFKEQGQKIDKIDASSEKVLQAIEELKSDVKRKEPAKPQVSEAPAPREDGLSKAALAQMLEQNANDVAAKSADAIHKEDVKLYKNVQAIVEENASRITKAVTAGNAKTAEDVAQTLGSLSQLEKINDLEASLAETKEELLNRTGGLKAKVTVAMILSIVNFIGVAVLVAIAFGFL